jgi:hypothetical protein
MTMSNDERRAVEGADDIAVNAAFVTALAADYAQHGRAAIEALRSADPARYLMMMALVCFDERYASAFADADGAEHG